MEKYTIIGKKKLLIQINITSTIWNRYRYLCTLHNTSEPLCAFLLSNFGNFGNSFLAQIPLPTFLFSLRSNHAFLKFVNYLWVKVFPSVISTARQSPSTGGQSSTAVELEPAFRSGRRRPSRTDPPPWRSPRGTWLGTCGEIGRL